MSDCVAFRHRILEADVHELQGTTDSPLARHLRQCESCAAAARRALAAYDALNDVLGSAPPIDAAAIVARARLQAVQAEGPGSEAAESAAEAESEVGAMSGASPHRQPGRRVIRAWSPWVTVGAAASIGALLLLSQREEPLPGVEVAPREAAHAMVEAPDDRNVAVIQTDNPDITVLWFF